MELQVIDKNDMHVWIVNCVMRPSEKALLLLFFFSLLFKKPNNLLQEKLWNKEWQKCVRVVLYFRPLLQNKEHQWNATVSLLPGTLLCYCKKLIYAFCVCFHYVQRELTSSVHV